MHVCSVQEESMAEEKQSLSAELGLKGVDMLSLDKKKEMVFLCLLRLRRTRRLIEIELEEARNQVMKASKKWKHLLRLKPRIAKKHRRPKRIVQRQRVGPMTDSAFDIYQHTGLLAEEFFNVFHRVEDDLRRPRTGTKYRAQNSLVDRARVAFVLTFLKKGQDYNLTTEWGVSSSYVSREVTHLIPIFASRCTFITLPKIWDEHPLARVVGAIDCTPHFRCRVHPYHHNYYRGDKKGFFLSAQLVSGLDGQIFDVEIFPGRVNDQMAFTITWQDLLSRERIRLLADGGYWDINLVTPNTCHSEKRWQNIQKAFRSVVEHVNSIIHAFRYATTKVRGHSPELQAYCLKVIYNLACLILRTYPLRNDLFLASTIFPE